MGARNARAGLIPECLCQSIRPGHGSGLANLEAGRYPALSRRGVRMLWTPPVDDRFRLAGVHGGGIVPAGGESFEGLTQEVSGGGGRGGCVGSIRTVCVLCCLGQIERAWK